MWRVFHLSFKDQSSFNVVVECLGCAYSTTTLNDDVKPCTHGLLCLVLSWHKRLAHYATGTNMLIYQPEQLGNQHIAPSLNYCLLNVVVHQIHLPPVRTLSRLTILCEGVGRIVMSDNIFQRPSEMLNASHSPRMVKHVVLDRGQPDKPVTPLGCARQVDSLGRVNPAWCIINQSWDWCDDASHARREIGTALFAIGGKWRFTMHGCIVPDRHNLPGCGHLAWPRWRRILEQICLAVSPYCGGIAYVH